MCRSGAGAQAADRRVRGPRQRGGEGRGRRRGPEEADRARPAQVTDADKATLEAKGALQTGEEYLGGRAKVQEGERVLVAGGGASGAWVCQAAQQAGAGEVDWTARHKLPRPPSTEEIVDPATGEKKVQFTEFGKIENEIQQRAAALGGKEPSEEDVKAMREAGDRYRSMVEAHQSKLEADAVTRAKDAEAALAALPAGGDPETEKELL